MDQNFTDKNKRSRIVAYMTTHLRPSDNFVTIDWLMAKEPRSIDGFVLRRRTDSPDTLGAKHVFMDSASRPEPVKKIPVQSVQTLQRTEEPALQKAAKQSLKKNNPKNEDLSADLETSLQNLGVEENSAISSEELPKDKKAKKLAKRQAKEHKKQLKKAKKGRIKRIIKWSLIGLAAIIVITAGFLVVKALTTTGKVFQGNPLSILTSKTRLQTDANGRTNIVIFGTEGYTMNESSWDGALLTDSIMVLSVDQDKHNAYMISLPRDLWVQHTCKTIGTTAGKLNETYFCAYTDNNNSENAGAAALQKTAGNILGLDVQYYVHANWTALVKMVDAVGGVDVTIDSDNPSGICDSATGVKYPNGSVHLDGEAALALARARGDDVGLYKCGGTASYGLAGGNFAREIYQQKILAALQAKALSAGTLANPATVNSLLDAIGDNLRTNFKTSEIQTLIDLAKNIKSDDIVSLPLVSRPNNAPDLVTTGMVGNASVVLPVAGQFDYSDIQAYIAQNLSSDPLVKENALIDVLNGSGEVGLAQRKAADVKANGFRVGQITNAPANITDAIQIYQINSAKTATAKALQDKFGVQPIVGPLAGYTTNADFVIIFGPGN